MENTKWENKIIVALEWATNCSEQTAKDLCKALRLKKSELDYLGFDETEYPYLYGAAKEG